MTTINPDATVAESALRPPTRRFLTAAAVSVAGNLLIFGAARIAGVDLLVPGSPGSDATIELTAGVVSLVSMLPLAVALAAALVLRRRRQGARAFTALVLVGLVLSFGPLVGAGLDGATSVTLALMHPVVAAAALWQLRPVAASIVPGGAAADRTAR